MFQDLTRFDVTKAFDASKVFAAVETSTKQALGYIPDAKQREVAETVAQASIDLAKAQNQAVMDFAAAVQAAVTKVTAKTDA
jgi:intracellular sulfur oxidation DsrE/DsrF family protein